MEGCARAAAQARASMPPRAGRSAKSENFRRFFLRGQFRAKTYQKSKKVMETPYLVEKNIGRGSTREGPLGQNLKIGCKLSKCLLPLTLHPFRGFCPITHVRVKNSSKNQLWGILAQDSHMSQKYAWGCPFLSPRFTLLCQCHGPTILNFRPASDSPLLRHRIAAVFGFAYKAVSALDQFQGAHSHTMNSQN